MSEYRVLGRSPVMRVAPDCGCPPFTPGQTALTCPASLGASDYAADWGYAWGPEPDPTISLTPTGSGERLLFSFLTAANGNVPSAGHMGEAAGWTTISNVEHVSKGTWNLGYRTGVGGTPYTAAATIGETGYLDDCSWNALIVALPTDATGIVQYKSAPGSVSATFDAPPSVGNMILLFAYAEGTYVWSGAWTQVAHGDTIQYQVEHPSTNGAGITRVDVLARCFHEGDGSLYGVTWSGGGYIGAAGVVIVEIAISGDMTDVDVVPETGQPVFDEVITPATDGTTALFATTHAYQDGSLRIFCDGINVTNDVTERAPDSGTFSLAWAPATDDVLMAEYRGI